MTTTIELIKRQLAVAESRIGEGKELFLETAQRLRELEAQVTDLELQLLTERGAKAWKDVPDATAFVEELRGNTDKPDCVWTPTKLAELDCFKPACTNAVLYFDLEKKHFCPNCGGAVKEST